MEFLTDLKSRLSFRANPKSSTETSLWSQLTEGDQFLVLEIDRSGVVKSTDADFCRMRGSEPDDVIGTSFHYLVNAEDRSELSALVGSIMGGGPADSVQARLLSNGESAPAIRWTIFPILSEDGGISGAVCVGVDLTPHLEGGERQERVNRELTELRQARAQIEKENLKLREEISRRDAEVERAEQAAAAAAAEAENRGPIPGLDQEKSERAPTLEQLERRYILHTLERTGGRISGAKGAAAILGLHANTLRSRMGKYGIERVAEDAGDGRSPSVAT